MIFLCNQILQKSNHKLSTKHTKLEQFFKNMIGPNYSFGTEILKHNILDTLDSHFLAGKLPFKDLRTQKNYFTYHTRQELSWYFLNCVMGSEGTLMTPATWGTTPNAQPNHRGRVFWKKSFFTFFGAQKVHYFGFFGALIDFLDQHTFFGPKTNGFRGVRLLAILDLRQFL